MSAKANYFALGLFVIVATLILVAGIVYLGAAEQFEERFQVETYFDDSVQGLDVGTPVKFRGVPVGTIERVTFAGDVYERPEDLEFGTAFGFVRVRFGLDYEAFPGLSEAQIRAQLAEGVAKGLRVRIASAGLMGTAYLGAELLDPQKYPPMELPWTPKRFYIPSAPGAFGVMMKSVEDTLGNLAEVDLKTIGDNLNTLLVNANKEVEQLQIGTVRDRAIALVDELRESNAKLKELLSKPELDKAIDDVGAAIAGVRGLVDDSQEDLKMAIANLRLASERIDVLLADGRVDQIVQGLADTSEQLPPAAMHARRSLQTLSNLLREEQQDIGILVQNLRQVSENLTALSGDAKENPARIIFGDPPPKRKLGE